MVFPRLLEAGRPGRFIPVFFLFIGHVQGQIPFPETFTDAAVTACGGCFVSRKGSCGISRNQASLGWCDKGSLSISHARPFATADLGISTLTAGTSAGRGYLGLAASGAGIPGLYLFSSWLSYGTKLHPAVTAGIGVHLFFSSISGERIRHPGTGAAAGLQATLNDRITLGGHIALPGILPVEAPDGHALPMRVSMGMAYTFFLNTTWYAEFHAVPGMGIRLSQGIEWTIPGTGSFQLGCHTLPFSVSGGFLYTHRTWQIHPAVEYDPANGPHPMITMIYEL